MMLLICVWQLQRVEARYAPMQEDGRLWRLEEEPARMRRDDFSRAHLPSLITAWLDTF